MCVFCFFPCRLCIFFAASFVCTLLSIFAIAFYLLQCVVFIFGFAYIICSKLNRFFYSPCICKCVSVFAIYFGCLLIWSFRSHHSPSLCSFLVRSVFVSMRLCVRVIFSILFRLFVFVPCVLSFVFRINDDYSLLISAYYSLRDFFNSSCVCREQIVVLFSLLHFFSFVWFGAYVCAVRQQNVNALLYKQLSSQDQQQYNQKEAIRARRAYWRI